jgi:hypothetical protein
MWRTLNLRDRPSTKPVTQQESSHAGNNICNLAIFPLFRGELLEVRTDKVAGWDRPLAAVVV